MCRLNLLCSLVLLALLLRPVAPMYCKYPEEIRDLSSYKILNSLTKTTFVNLFIADCVQTDGPCPHGYSPSCGTYNGAITYLSSIPNQLEFTSSCDEIRTTSNLPRQNFYKTGISPVRFFLQCEKLCNTINATHFWSELHHCPSWDVV